MREAGGDELEKPARLAIHHDLVVHGVANIPARPKILALVVRDWKSKKESVSDHGGVSVRVAIPWLNGRMRTVVVTTGQVGVQNIKIARLLHTAVYKQGVRVNDV